MIQKKEGDINFLRFYLDPELLNQAEAREALQEQGVNLEVIKEKGKSFIKKLEAKQALREAKIKKEEFLNIVEKFKEEENANIVNENPGGYIMAARKQNEEDNPESCSEINDAKLLKRIKEKNS